MTSYTLTTMIGTEFDKVMKEITGGDSVEEKQEDNGISVEDLVADQNRQAASEKQRKVRQAKMQKEREEVRQKIRDKYNIKKKDEPNTQAHGTTTTTTTANNETIARGVHQVSKEENQGFDPMKMTTNAFNSLKEKFGWK